MLCCAVLCCAHAWWRRDAKGSAAPAMLQGYKPTGTLWPAPAFIDPILVSMHFYPPMYPEFGSKDSLAYMKAHAPVGTRDTQTLGFLQAKMPPASSYLSLCLTSTLESVARPGAVPECPVLLVDVPDELLPLLPPAINRKACRMAAKLYDNRTMDGMFRVGHAFDHLTRYARAGVVITTRLHCGVPAAAMGIPVILVRGGGGVGRGMKGGGRGGECIGVLTNLRVSHTQARQQKAGQLRVGSLAPAWGCPSPPLASPHRLQLSASRSSTQRASLAASTASTRFSTPSTSGSSAAKQRLSCARSTMARRRPSLPRPARPQSGGKCGAACWSASRRTAPCCSTPSMPSRSRLPLSAARHSRSSSSAGRAC